MFNFFEGVILMENTKKMILAAVVALVMGQTVVAHEGCQAPVSTHIEVDITETAQTPVVAPVEPTEVQEEENLENVVTAPVTEDTTEDVVTTETEEVPEESEVENLLNTLEQDSQAK